MCFFIYMKGKIMEFFSEAWNGVLTELRKLYSENLIELWFNELKIEYIGGEPSTAVISTKQKFKRAFLESKYTSSVENCLEKVLGFDVKAVFIATEEKSADEQLIALGFSDCDSSEDSDISDIKESVKKENKNPGVSFLDTDFREGINNISEDITSGEQNKTVTGITANLNSDYSFENFIVGDSNKFAHAACLAVANKFSASGKAASSDSLQKQYNPLFIYGPSGLGKTHLLYAVMNRIYENEPSAKIVYVKGEDFTNQLVDSISLGTCEQFRNKYRKASILLIDDIQFIAGKPSTQEEFFHTFNALYEKHKQIILTSDRPPRDLKTLETRLQTRFEWGLTADIQPPGFELRIAILKSKAEALNIDLPSDVLEYLANNLKNNVRQLEGAVKKLGARSFLTGDRITVDLAVSCIADLLTGSEPVSVTVDRILEKVSKKYGISIEDIKGRKRTKEIAFARHISIYIIRKLTGMSFPAIGKTLGRNHTTIMSSLDTVEKDLDSNTLLEIEINELIREIKE